MGGEISHPQGEPSASAVKRASLSRRKSSSSSTTGSSDSSSSGGGTGAGDMSKGTDINPEDEDDDDDEPRPSDLDSTNSLSDDEAESSTKQQELLDGGGGLSPEQFGAGYANDYKENEMKEVRITEKFSILVGRHEDKFYGFGSKCPHRGAPLLKGHLSSGIIKCPWHGACFDIKTGEIEDYPGEECIPKYNVIQDLTTGELTVSPNPNEFGIYKIQRPLLGQTRTRRKVFVILGAGAAAIVCAQTLRENNFKGRIIMISKDSHLPYDRTKLSKGLPQEWEDVKIKDPEWFKLAQVEMILKSEISKVDFQKKKVFVRNHNSVYYSKLMIATGCRPTIPQSKVPGSDLKNVLTLYSFKDSRKIRGKCKGKNVVIQGSGFVGMELLTPLTKVCSSIIIICRSNYPYSTSFGDTFGAVIKSVVQMRYPNVFFLTGDEVESMSGNKDGEVVQVLTKKNRSVRCELFIYAIGGTPNTEFVKESGLLMEPKLEMDSRGFLSVSEHMETSIPDVYAAGDLAQMPLRCSVKKLVNVPHWGMAQKMGKVAALKALENGWGTSKSGKEINPSTLVKAPSIYDTVPFVSTTVAGVNVRYVGSGSSWTRNYIFGNTMDLKFCILYKRDEKILACLTVNCDPICAKMSFDIENQIEFKEGDFPQYITDMFPDKPIIGSAELSKKE